MRNIPLILFLLIVSAFTAAGQNTNTLIVPGATLFSKARFAYSDSGRVIIADRQLNCKGLFSESFLQPQRTFAKAVPTPVQVIKKESTPLLIIHGNVSYDYFYRSKIDTPFNQTDLQQHTERVNLQIALRNKYPLKVSFGARQSNSPFFRNFIDANFSFDRFGFTKNLKQQLLDQVNAMKPGLAIPDLQKLEEEIKKNKEKASSLQKELSNSSLLQKIVEERERVYYQKLKHQQDSLNKLARVKEKEFFNSGNSKKLPGLNKKDSITNLVLNRTDSIKSEAIAVYAQKKATYDSLNRSLSEKQRKADSIKMALQKDLGALKQKIYSAKDATSLAKIASENGLDYSGSKTEKKLSAIKSFSVGRTPVNYTELTAQNIIVTGINVEYNPSYYLAFTAGKIDYRFRDFYTKHAKNNDQYLVMGRIGVGDPEKKALILSVFEGKKNTAGFSVADSVKSYVNIIGYSLEGTYRVDKNTFISAEFAKSTKPVIGSAPANKQQNALTHFSDKSNMGINIKGQTFIPQTHTSFSGFYRKSGKDFQSFSLFSYNSDQTAWLLRADQAFKKEKIIFTGMLRRNDFSNPFADKTYRSTTIFKTAILNIRYPKYPSLTLGYYPGTQLYFIDKDKIKESAYYILNGSSAYSYVAAKQRMTSLITYNKYISRANDSGFVSYRGENYYLAQSVFFRKLWLQGGYAYTSQPEIKYYTLESEAGYAISEWLTASAGLKYNHVAGGNTSWGSKSQLSVALKKFGSFQFQYEKSFLTTITQTLYPVETGRVSWYKIF